MKALFRLFVVAVLFVTPVHAGTGKATIRVVADEWPLFSGAELPYKGLSLHIISAVFERASYAVQNDVLPWARIMDGARRSEFDVVGSLFFDPALEEFLEYGEPFHTTDVRLVQRSGDTHAFTSVPDLQPLSIAVGDGFLYEDEFDRADYLNKVTVTTTLQALRMVAFGRVDVTLDSVDVVNYSTGTLDPDLAGQLEFVPGVMTSQDIHMATRKDLPNLDQTLEDFNATLLEMKMDGSLAAILAQHVKQ